jgi:hypothetical protein
VCALVAVRRVDLAPHHACANFYRSKLHFHGVRAPPGIISPAGYSASLAMTISRLAVLLALALLLRMVSANDQPRFEVVGSALGNRGAGADC